MIEIDQFGRKVDVPEYPHRIISLVPSQTELLADLNLGDRVVGITRFCERPRDWFYAKARVGGTKDPDVDRIAALKPDLIIGNAEENTKKSVQELEHRYPVWISDVNDLHSALSMINEIGRITQRSDSAQEWIDRISSRFDRMQVGKTGLKVLYLIWKEPWMAVGRDTFINSMIEAAGFENVLTDPTLRYPKLEEDEIRDLNPDFVFLSTEPFPFSEEHVANFKDDFQFKAHLVDGGLFSWYGTRLVHSPAYFEKLQAKLL